MVKGVTPGFGGHGLRLIPSVVTSYPCVCDPGQCLTLPSFGFLICKWSNANIAPALWRLVSLFLSGEALGLEWRAGISPAG